MTILKLAIEDKIDSKVVRNEETESAGKRNSPEKPPPEKSTNFHGVQRNFHDNHNDNKEENRLIVKDTNIENNNDNDID